MYLRPVKWMPEVLIQFTTTKKIILTIRNAENYPLLKFKKKQFRKKKLISLAAKSRNYYQEGIRYVPKVYVVKIYAVKVYYILTFSKQSTYES